MDERPGGDAPLDLEAALRSVGPLGWPAAIGLVERGRELLSAGEFEPAARHFQRVTGFDDPAVTASALLGLGEALYRLDLEDEALGAWQAVLALPETPSTYAAWRNVAAARVRGEDLRGAMAAYREADRRAPAEDKAEIAARLGWLAKETGDQGLARRYFARSRGDGPALPLSYVVLGLTVIVSFIALSADGLPYLQALELDKALLAAGELYRLVSVTLVHANLLHLAFNMYALYLLGPLVEGIWGTKTFAIFYLLTAAGASTASFVVSPGSSVGASGAIFGLVGVLLAGTRFHNPVLDRRARSIIPQLGSIVVINLAFGFLMAGRIDNAAHIGGLVAGLWLGLVVPPGRVRTLRSFWGGGDQGSTGRTPMLTAVIGTAALIAAIAAGLLQGGLTL
ncbi:MAG TPA: rhomboid family intramembrane serine protease [Candidatus Sulfomarinibacteraceae bacterium]|nr:rhomboid family intramembrane serine protease [Candidatus Sulfomarinibacteraceae bacterium]